MKQKLLKMMMLLCAMMTIGSGEVWGEEKITLNYSSFSLTNSSYSEKTATVDGFGFTVDQGYKGSGNVIQMNSSKGDGILYNTTAIPGLKSIKVNVSSGNKTYTITTGTSEKPSTNNQTGTTGGTYNANTGDTYFQLKVSGASYFSSIEITYESGPTTHSLTYSATNGSISGVVYNTSTAVASGSSVAEGGQVTLTAAPSDGYRFESWSVSGTGSSLSSTTDNPTTFTMGTADATVTANFVAAGDYITVSPTSTNVVCNGDVAGYTLTTNLSTPSYTVAYYTTSAGDETTTKPTWIGDVEFSGNTLNVEVTANEGVARTAYLKVYSGATYSSLITINQAAKTYEIDQYSTPATAHGTVTFSPSSPIDAGAEVTLTATPDDGYVFTADSWSFYKESGNDYVLDNSITVTDNKITMPSYDLYVDATFTPIAVTGVTLDKTTASISVGDTETLTATIAPANALNKNITWTSSDTGIATVSNGVVTGVALGSATITATTEDGSFTATCTVSVENAVTFDATVDTGTSSIEKNGVSFACNNGVLNNESEYRLYKNSETTISVTSGRITKIEFTGVSSNPASGFGTQTGWTTDGNNGTWTGKAASVSFTASGAQVRASKIKVFVATTATPTFSVAEGEYNEAKDVTISCATDGATIYYTTDGTNPTSSSAVYSSAVHITETTTLKAIAIKDEIESDDVASANYTMIRPAAPTFDVAASVFDTTFDLHLSTETDGATIYYTTDESTPTTSSTVYSTKVSIPAETTTVKAIAVKDGLTSDVSSVTYTYDPRTTPTFSLSATSIDLKVNETSSAVTLTTSSDATPSFTCADAHVTLTGTGNSRTITADAAGTYTVNVSVSGSANYKDAEGTITVNVTKKATTMVLTPSFTSKDLHVTTTGSLTGVPQYNSADIAGAEVTYSSSDTKVASIAADGTITFKKVGSTTITASYAGDDEYEACQNTYELTLTDSSPQSTEVNITFGNALYKTSYTGAGAAGNGPFEGTVNNVTVNVAQGSGANLYITNTETRIYGGTTKGTITITAPAGYVMTKIEITKGSSWSVTASPGTLSTATWTGCASEVVFSASARSDFQSATVTLAETVTVGSAGYTTYVAKHDISFPEGVEAFIATAKSSNTVTLTSKASVPEGTAIVVRAAAGTYALPAIKTTPESVSGNLLAASDGTVEGDGSTIFALGVGQAGTNEGKVGFFLVGDGVTVPAGKAYLEVPAAVKDFLMFEFDETGIEGVDMVQGEGFTVNGPVYNLAGQRLSKPQKGINIINGRKVLVK